MLTCECGQAPSGGSSLSAHLVTAGNGLTGGAADALARTLLEVAAEVDRDEQCLKRALIEAAEQGDAPQVRALIAVWMDRPAREVLDMIRNCGK